MSRELAIVVENMAVDEAQDAGLEEALDAALAASRVMIGQSIQTLGEHTLDLTLTQYRMLLILSVRGPQRPSDVMGDLNVSAATAGRCCAKLETLGLVKRSKDPGDGRATVCVLDTRGRLLVEHVFLRRREVFRDVLVKLDPEHLPALAAAFKSFTEASSDSQDLLWSLRRKADGPV